MARISQINTCSSNRVKVKVADAKYLNLSKKITPDILRSAADKLEDDDINQIEFSRQYSYGKFDCYIFRPETIEEVIKREEKEERARIKKEEALRKEKDALIKKATALGMKVIE